MTDEDARPSGAPRIPRASAPNGRGPQAEPAVARRRSLDLPRLPDPVRRVEGAGASVEDPTQPARRLSLKGAYVTLALVGIMCVIEAIIALEPALRSIAPALVDGFAALLMLNESFRAPLRLLVIDAYAFQPIQLYGVLQGAFPLIEAKTLLTHQFLHGFPLHLAFNMLALLVLAPPLERAAGPVKFLLLFLLCGVGGAVGQFAWEMVDAFYVSGDQRALLGPMVGASGAIFGLLGADLGRRAYALSQVPRERRLVSPASYLIRSSAAIILINVLIEFLPILVAGAAHLGGFIVGLALGPLLAGGKIERLSRR